MLYLFDSAKPHPLCID